MAVDHGARAVADHDRGAGDIVHHGAEVVDVQPVRLDDELGAVAVDVVLVGLKELVGDAGGRGRRNVGDLDVEGRPCHVFARDAAPHALHDYGESLPAGVDDARLLQDGQHLGGLGDGLRGAVAGDAKDGRDVVSFPCRFAGGVCDGGDDGEHRALDGVGDGLVGVFPCEIAGAGEVLSSAVGIAVKTLGEALEELREDDAAVAASAHERAGVEDRHGLGGGGSVQPAEVFKAALHGEVHVRAGVAVGDGEDVERVDGFGIGAEGGPGRREHGREVGAVETIPGIGRGRSVVGRGHGAEILVYYSFVESMRMGHVPYAPQV